MKTSVFHEYSLSQFMLGTVQFGANYGIANKAGRPSYQTVLKILECAAENGVNCLDTASAYGDSEEVIGKAMRELGLTDNMVVVTKALPLDDNLKPSDTDKLIRQGVETSLKNLQLDILPICLFHRESNTVYADSLRKMKEKGLVKHIGISVNSSDGALKAIRSGHFEAMQIPSSILDQRYFKNGIFHEAKRNGIALFVRSVYLQGLLFLPENEIPAELAAVIEVRRRLEQLANKAKMSLAEMAARFVMSLEGVASLVLGLETIDQLQANLQLFGQGSLSEELLHDVLETVPQLPDGVIVPSLWPKMAR
jgi:aryl-alcohol dehydrogenase-like predicted oxidoreductase